MAVSNLETVEDYIADARVLLQDTIAPYRYDDDSLLTALNVTLQQGRRLRPDLFVYRHKHVPAFDKVGPEEVEMEESFRLAFIYGLVSHAISRDQEDVQDQRAATFMQTFIFMLTGLQPPAIQGGTPNKPAKG